MVKDISANKSASTTLVAFISFLTITYPSTKSAKIPAMIYAFSLAQSASAPATAPVHT